MRLVSISNMQPASQHSDKRQSRRENGGDDRQGSSSASASASAVDESEKVVCEAAGEQGKDDLFGCRGENRGAV